MRQYIKIQEKYVLVYKNSGEVLSKLKSREFRAISLSTYDFSTLNTTLPHNIIKEKLRDLIERTLKREETLYLFVTIRRFFSLLQTINRVANHVIFKDKVHGNSQEKSSIKVTFS